ncbi:GNAT family N-acetyltransferase [Bacillus sp. FJAT-47783]|uniref:GNAT family N-acetyltransferase n=1 Tax=Bacillus sp. FJAT-47783 TaxID=2922712 RepID=UPI001FABF3CE|nr:GNAT family N-acetyltransferase [Bacillus sp. FJAT-47783]
MLSSQQLEEIKKLQSICAEADSIKLKLNWELLENRESGEVNDFFHYENGELVGFLGLYGFGNKIELCGMVHPNHRRKGIFSQLFRKAITEVLMRNYREILFNAPASSSSAKAFLKSVPCEYASCEYQMKWEDILLTVDDDVAVRMAQPDDLEAEIQLDVQCFGFNEEEARIYNERIKNEGSQAFYMIEWKHQTVGKIRLFRHNGEAWIFGFSVFPDYQGKGIGRKALQQIILKEKNAGFTIFLEVEAKNTHALKLYESCGFHVFQAQDYYRYLNDES